MKNLSRLVLCVGMMASLCGCGGTVIHGKVLAGDVGRVIRVSDSDTRLEEGGVEGVRVSIIQGGQRGSAMSVLAKGESDKDGAFKMSIDTEILRAGRILVRAESESVFKVENLVEFPRDGEGLMVQVIERVVSPDPAPEEEPE